MEQRRTLIRDFEKEIDSHLGKISDLNIRAGTLVFEKHKKEARQLSQNDYDSAKKEQQREEEIASSIDRIREMSSRLKEIDEKHQAAVSEIETLERSNLPVFEKLGEEGFLIYHQNPLGLSSYQEIFSEMEDQMKEVENIDQDIQNIQDRTSGRKFFERIADKGQIAYLKSVKMVRSRGSSRLFTQMGKELAQTGFVENSGSEELKEIVAPYVENRKKIETLDEERKALESEKESLNEELHSLGVDGRPEKTVSELENEMAECRELFSGYVKNIGITARQEENETINGDTAFTDIVASIDESEKKIRQFRENITKLEAAIEVDNLAKQISRMNQAVADYEERIKEHQNEIKRLESRIAESEKEKKRLEKVRGPEEITLQS